MARTCTNNLRVVFSPYVQHCPCEASEQKWSQKSSRFLAFLAQKFFGDLNQNSDNKISAKSSYLAILKISCKKIEKWRRSRKKCKVHFCKIAN